MKKSPRLVWPQDTDGDVLRRMESSGFDFETSTDIDFNIDFNDWPPPQEFIEHLRKQFPQVIVYEPDEHGSGYIGIIVTAVVTYELVMLVQSSVSELAAPFGGICESWGVLH